MSLGRRVACNASAMKLQAKGSIALLVVLSCVFSGTYAQDEGSCEAVTQTVKEATSALSAAQTQLVSMKEEVASLKSELSAAQAEAQRFHKELSDREAEVHRISEEGQKHYEEKVARTTQLTAVQGEVQRVAAELEAQTRKVETLEVASQEGTTLKAKLAAKLAELDVVKAEVARVKAKYGDRVKELQEKLEATKLAYARVKSFNLTDIMGAARSYVVSVATASLDEAKGIFEELKGGNTTRLGGAAMRGVRAVEGAGLQSYRFMAKQVFERLPEPVQKKVADAVAKAKVLLKERIMESAWVQEAIKRLSAANTELKEFITKTLEKKPALKPLADPVYVQLMVYGILSAPLMLLMLPILMLVAPARVAGTKAKVDSVIKARKEKRKAGKGPQPAGGKK